MDIRSGFRINSAIIIILAFIFRLFFLNVYLYSVTNSSSATKVTSTHFSELFKNRQRDVEKITSGSTTPSYADVVVFAEKNDSEKNLLKANTPILLSFFFALFVRTLNFSRSRNLFEAIKCNLSPKKYLAQSVLRI